MNTKKLGGKRFKTPSRKRTSLDAKERLPISFRHPDDYRWNNRFFKGRSLKIFQQLEQARNEALANIYELDRPPALQAIHVGEEIVFLKREDQSRIRSYKWRGAFNKLRHQVDSGDRGPFVATSAGNHAQGVALAASRLDVQAFVFMPRTTPRLKQEAVVRHGGNHVTVKLVGDNFEQASISARKFAEDNSCTVIEPFDDLHVIAGQSTIADEILQASPEMDDLYCPVGGGGLVSGLAYACDQLKSKARVIGVEVTGQDSMNQSLIAGHRIRLDRVDLFCDGTAVPQPGQWTFDICKRFLHRTVTVTNEQVCAAIQLLWEQARLIPEPSGAIALAGLIADRKHSGENLRNRRCCAIVTGANTDFLTLPVIVRKSQLAQPSRCYYRFEIDERNGSLIQLLDLLFEDVNIVDFQYGKTSIHQAYPVLGLYATPKQQEKILERLESNRLSAEDVSAKQATQFRVIPFRPDLTNHTLFLEVDFPDRPGALREMMREISSLTNICYFNFNDTGQSQGHALIGFEFANPDKQQELTDKLTRQEIPYRIADMTGILTFS